MMSGMNGTLDSDEGQDALHGVLEDLRGVETKLSRAVAAVDVKVVALMQERENLQASLGQVRKLIDTVGNRPVALSSTSAGPVMTFSGSGTLTVGGSPSAIPTIREVVVRLLQSDARPFETSEILEEVRRAGIESQDASTRSILSKLADREDGPIKRIRRGLYEARRRTWDQVEFGEHAEPPVPTSTEFMAMRSQPGDEDEQDADDGRLFSDEDVRGHPARGEDEPEEASSS